MAWIIDVFGRHSGQPLGKIPVTSLSGACSLNQGEGGSVGVSVNHPDWVGTDWDDLLMPERRFVVFSWFQEGMSQPLPHFAGVVQDWDKDYGSGVRDYILRDYWNVLDGLTLIDYNHPRPAESEYPFGPAALSTLAGRVVNAVNGNPGSVDHVPMTFPPYAAGSTELLYKGHNASNAKSALEDIIAWSSNLDVWFRPIIDVSTGALSFDMMAEDNLYSWHVEDINLDGGDGAQLKRRHSTSQLATHAFVFGEGSGDDTPVGKARVENQIHPRRDLISKDHKTRVVPPLTNHAEKILGWNDSPRDSYELSLPLSSLSYLRPGMSLKINGAGDPDFPSEMLFRVAGYSFSDSGTVQVDIF